MFSIEVEEVFQISGRKGITLIGKTSGVISIGDYLIDNNDRANQYKVIAIESVRFTDREKCLTHNPAVIIEADINNSVGLKGKVLKTHS